MRGSVWKTFRTWLPGHGETEATGEDMEVQTYEDAGDAAVARHECFNRDSEIAHHLVVHVRDGTDVRVFESHAEYDIRYYAVEKKAGAL